MGKRVPLPLGLKAGTGQSTLVSCENVINMFLEVKDGKPYLLGIPGQVAYSEIGGTVRGQFSAGGVHFAVRGETLYTIPTTGVEVSRGTIEGTERCDFAYDGRYVAIVADLKTYYYEVSTATLTEITDPDFEQANSVTVAAGLFVFSRNGTGQIAWPDFDDATAFGGLDFAEAETSPDQLIAVRESAQELLLFSRDTLEFFRFTGNPDQYFEASNSATALKTGALCRDAIVDIDNAPIWLATNKEGGVFVARLEGTQAKNIGDTDVGTILGRATMAQLEAATAFGTSKNNHSFYVLTIPDVATLAYDASLGRWAARVAGTWPLGTPGVPEGDWGVRDFAVNADLKPIIGKTDGDLYELSFDSFSQDGAGIVREFTAPPFALGGVSFSISEIELICATGVGLSSGTGSTPYVQLALSFDGGKTWSDPFIEELGPLGEYGWGVRFTRLGRCPGPKGVSARFRCTDAVEFTPAEAWITIEAGTR